MKTLVVIVHGLGANADGFWGNTCVNLQQDVELIKKHIRFQFFGYETELLPRSKPLILRWLTGKRRANAVIGLMRHIGLAKGGLPALRDVGRRLLSHLKLVHEPFNSIKLVGHSMGGIVVCAAVNETSKQKSNDFVSNTIWNKLAGISFIASPLKGASNLDAIIGNRKINLDNINPHIESLRPCSETRGVIIKSFIDCMMPSSGKRPKKAICIFRADQDDIVDENDLNPFEDRVEIAHKLLYGGHSKCIQNLGDHNNKLNRSIFLEWIRLPKPEELHDFERETYCTELSNMISIRLETDVDILPLKIKRANQKTNYALSDYHGILCNTGKPIALIGKGGAGKSFAIGQVAKALLSSKDAFPVLVDLQMLQADSSDNSGEGPGSEQSDRQSRNAFMLAISKAQTSNSEKDIRSMMNVLLQYALPWRLDVARLKDQVEKPIILIDAANEIGDIEFRKGLFALLSKAFEQFEWDFVVTERTKETLEPGKWIVDELLEIEEAKVVGKLTEQYGEEEVKRLTKGAYGKGFDIKMLCNPFFLNWALRDKQSKSLDNLFSAKKFETYFLGVMPGEKPPQKQEELKKVSRIIYEMYKDGVMALKPTQVEELGPQTISALERSRVLLPRENIYTVAHQTYAGYLASRYLVSIGLENGPTEWTHAVFDGLSRDAMAAEATDPEDAILFAIDSLRQRERDQLFERIYDWSWHVALRIIDVAYRRDLELPSTNRMGAIIHLAIARGTDDKNAMALLEQISPKLKSEELSDPIGGAEEWYRQWHRVFSVRNVKELEEAEVVDLILDVDSMVGWAASNKIREFATKQPEVLMRLNRFYKCCGNGESAVARNFRDDAIRWRIVHALGKFRDAEARKTLTSAAGRDDYVWVRFGAMRALTEWAGEASVCDQALDAALVALKQWQDDREGREWIPEIHRLKLAKHFADSTSPQADRARIISLVSSLQDTDRTLRYKDDWKKLLDSLAK